MIPSAPGCWIHRDDFDREIPGRVDDPSMRDHCWRYLEDTYGEQEASIDEQRAQASRATGELIAARERAKTTRPARETEGEVEALRKTVDHLLVYVPARAAPLPAERFETIVTLIRDSATTAFGAGHVAVDAFPEPDLDTSACHRIAVEVQPAAEFDAGEFAAKSFALHRLLAHSLTPEEFRAVRLTVDLA